jgi:hypothetical protein
MPKLIASNAAIVAQSTLRVGGGGSGPKENAGFMTVAARHAAGIGRMVQPCGVSLCSHHQPGTIHQANEYYCVLSVRILWHGHQCRAYLS